MSSQRSWTAPLRPELRFELADRYFADALQGYFMDSADSVARARFAHERLLELTRLG